MVINLAPTEVTESAQEQEKLEVPNNGRVSKEALVERKAIETSIETLEKSIPGVRDEFGGICTERIFPSIQPDLDVVESYERGLPVVNSNTGHRVGLENYADYWVLPGGVTVSAAAESVYFPEDANEKIVLMILRSQGGALGKMAGEEGFGIVRVAIVPKVGDQPRFESVAFGEQEKPPVDEEEVKQYSPLEAGMSVAPKEDALPDAEINARVRAWQEPPDDIPVDIRFPDTGVTASRHKTRQEGLAGKAPPHPEKEADRFEVIELRKDPRFPFPPLTEQPGYALGATWLRKNRATLNDGIRGEGLREKIYTSEQLFKKYRPRLFSPDLIVLQNRESDEYLVLAKGTGLYGDSDRDYWYPNRFGGEDAGLAIQEWLYKLETGSGKHDERMDYLDIPYGHIGFKSKTFQTKIKTSDEE